MISSFSQYLVEEANTIYFTFGRMNPPTIGHGKLLDKLAAKAGKNPYRIYLSQSQDKNKNPLGYTDKVKHCRKMFPKHARQILVDKKVKMIFDALVSMYNDGFKSVALVVGDDRVNEFDLLLKKYNGSKGRHGFYNFEKIQVISAGQRDPDAEGAEGASATKQRSTAKNNDFRTFSMGLPRGLSNGDAKKLFNDVRTGLGIKEEASFKNHVELEKVSDIREQFVAGEIYNIGDTVLVLKTNEKATITMRGSNYVIVERKDLSRRRMWLDSIDLVNENAGEDGTDELIKNYKSQTPGQSENLDHVKTRIAKDKKREDEADDKDKIEMKRKHDRMMDAARRARMLKKNNVKI
jgi:hypothetical protein